MFSVADALLVGACWLQVDKQSGYVIGAVSILENCPSSLRAEIGKPGHSLGFMHKTPKSWLASEEGLAGAHTVAGLAGCLVSR